MQWLDGKGERKKARVFEMYEATHFKIGRMIEFKSTTLRIINYPIRSVSPVVVNCVAQ